MSSPMEFLKANKLNTTSMLVVPADNSGTQAYLFDRNPNIPFTSSGFESNSSCVITVTMSSADVGSHLLIQNHNLKQFRVFYDGATANSLAIVTQNSQTSTYISFNSVTFSSISLQMDIAMTANTEKSVGELIVTERRLAFAVNPSAQNFSPSRKRKRIRHEMPDGGVKLLQIANKYNTSIRLEFISESFRGSLESVNNEGYPLYFVPFPTTTGWGGNGMGEAYEVMWTSDWDFVYGTNDKQGYNGGILLEETPSA